MLRVGLVGVGYWGRHFIRVITESSKVILTSVCDNNHIHLLEIKALYSDKQFHENYWEVDLTSIDIVVITTPASTHYKITKYFLSKNKHVLCEKPLCLSLAEARELEKISRDLNRVLMVGHTFLYNSVVQYMEQSICKNEIGKLLHAQSSRTGLGPIREDVGVVEDLATHDIAIFNYFFKSKPLSVAAFGQEYFKAGKVDIANIMLEYPNSIFATITVSWLHPFKERNIKVLGTSKMLEMDDVSLVNKLKVYNVGNSYQSLKGNFGNFQLSVKDGDVLIPNIFYNEPLTVELNHFVECIENNTPPLTDINNAMAVIETIIKINDSLSCNGIKIYL